MRLKRAQLAELIDRELKGGQLTAEQIAAYLMHTGQTGQLNSLARDIQSLRADAGTVELTATSSHKLTKQAEAGIEHLVKEVNPNAKRTVINHELNTQLIGGFKLRLPRYELDLSLRGRLNQLKQNLNAERSTN